MNSEFSWKAVSARMFAPRYKASREVNILCRRSEAYRHHEQLVESINRYWDRPKFQRKLALDSLSSRRRYELQYMNPFAALPWTLGLEKALNPYLDNHAQAFMITAIHDQWHTNDCSWSIDPKSIRRDIWHGLRGINYVGMVEFALFQNVAFGHGRLVAPHFQGIAWGENLDARSTRKSRKFFRGGLNGSNGLWVKKITNKFGALSYAVKLPAYGYRLIKRRSGTFGHSSTRLYLPSHYQLFTHLGQFTLPDLAISGGEGANVLRSTKKELGWPLR